MRLTVNTQTTSAMFILYVVAAGFFVGGAIVFTANVNNRT